MEFITDILNTIKNARKGKDMRQAIYDGIKQCYNDATGHPESVAATVKEIEKVSANLSEETANRKTEVDVERKRIDNLIKELPATAGEYQQSKLVLHGYDNTAVKCTTTSGNYTNVPAFTTDQGGPLSSLYTKKSNYQIAVNKSGLYLFELRIHVNSLTANKRVELAPFVNDTRNAALASSYNTAGNFTLTQVAALPLWLSANDTVDFRIAPIEAAEVSLQLGDVLVYAIDWEDKFKIPDYTGYAAETKDIRTGADGTVYGTAGEAVRKQIGNLTEDLDNIKKKKNVVIYVGSSELSDEQKLSCDYICNGVDDQIEINQAIDSLPDSGGEIHLSRGIFNITNSITIRKRIKLTGEGKGITLDRNSVNNGGTTLLSELTGGCIIQIEKSDTLSDIKGITLSDFQIVGAGINVVTNFCNGINITTYTDCVTLERLAICHCFYGLLVDQSATVDDISVTNCDFQRDATGIYIYGQGWQTRIENNIFWDMSGRQATCGIVLSAGKNIVSGNYFGVSSLVSQDRTNAWITVKNAVSLLCNGNSFSRCTSSPIRFEAGGQFASISGNSFSEIGKAQFQSNERAVLYVDGAGTGGGRISFTNNTVFWANDDTWKTSYLAYLTNQVAQVNISNNTVIDGIGKINEDELVYKSEDSAYAITIGNNVLC